MEGNHHESHKTHEGHKGRDHHAHMVSDFRQRFWVSLGATLPILILSPLFLPLSSSTGGGRFSKASSLN